MIPNEPFYEQLLAWREQIAKKENVMPNMVMTEKTMASVAEKLPATLKALGTIKGVGAHKATLYGHHPFLPAATTRPGNRTGEFILAKRIFNIN